MNAAAGWPSHWVTRMTRAMSASRAVRRFVTTAYRRRDGVAVVPLALLGA